MTFTTRTKTGLAGALAGGLIITGVLVSTAAPAVAPTPPPHPSLATLIAGSKKEDGKLVIYGNPSQQVMAPVIAAFQAAYPWVKITHARPAQLVSAVLARPAPTSPRDRGRAVLPKARARARPGR